MACVVIEDSLLSVQAGVTASMKVRGYAGDPMTNAAALESTCAHVFDDMAALPDFLLR